ncbi:MAG: hypothetical protein ACKVX7_11525 [Planctomycetota bacterium]
MSHEMSRHARLLLLALVVILLVHVKVTAQAPEAPPPTPPTPAKEKPAAPAGVPVPGLGVLELKTPAEWKSVPPTSGMRKAQFQLPRVKDDTADGEFVVFYFGRDQGGGADANLERWIKQFERPAKVSEADFSRRFNKVVNGIKVTLLEVHGTYIETQFGPGNSAKPGTPRPDYALLGAVVETTDGNYFLKATGPDKTMRHWRDAWQKMIDELKQRAPATAPPGVPPATPAPKPPAAPQPETPKPGGGGTP